MSECLELGDKTSGGALRIALAEVVAAGVVVELLDLQGNVVATAALSEAETKLLSTYNSTEFGVPQPGTSPPKYSWLGATGLTSESSTGTIVKDGVTYVPQTGRPLQTQSLTVPIPQNAAKEYTDTLEPWVAEGDAAAATQQVANAEQARRAIELANQPPGVIPSGNPGWWCGGEYGACEGEGGEGGGEGGGGGGCSGMNACAASRHGGLVGYHERGDGSLGCSVWASWGNQGLLAQITIYGHTECRGAVEVPRVEVQIALFMNGAMVGAPATENFTVYIGEVSSFHHTWNCPREQATYRAWVWGHQYGAYGKGAWFGWGFEAATRTECKDPLGEAGPPPVPIPPRDG